MKTPHAGRKFEANARVETRNLPARRQMWQLWTFEKFGYYCIACRDGKDIPDGECACCVRLKSATVYKNLNRTATPLETEGHWVGSAHPRPDN